MYGKHVLRFCLHATLSFLSIKSAFETDEPSNSTHLNLNGKECSEARDCIQYSSRVVCNSGTCECPLAYFPVHRNLSIDCVKENLEFGELCSFDFQCRVGLNCINGQCICPHSTYTLNEEKIWINPSVDYGTFHCVNCLNTNFCQVISGRAFCSKHSCMCIDSFVQEQITTHQTVRNIKCLKKNACVSTFHCKTLETSKTVCSCDQLTQECKCSKIAEDKEENFANIKHIVLKVSLSCIVFIVLLGVTVTLYRYRYKISVFCSGSISRIQNLPLRLRNRQQSTSVPTRPEGENGHVLSLFNSPSAPPAEFNLTSSRVLEQELPSYEQIMKRNKTNGEMPPPNYEDIK